MTFPDEQDIHHRHIAALITRKDWAALIRYWMVTGHTPSLTEASNLLRQLPSENRSVYVRLAQFLERVAADRPETEGYLTVDECAEFSIVELLTLCLLGHYDIAVDTKPGSLVVADGLEAPAVEVVDLTERCRSIAAHLPDLALQAFFSATLANYRARAGDFEASMPLFHEAISRYEDAAQRQADKLWTLGS